MYVCIITIQVPHSVMKALKTKASHGMRSEGHICDWDDTFLIIITHIIIIAPPPCSTKFNITQKTAESWVEPLLSPMQILRKSAIIHTIHT